MSESDRKRRKSNKERMAELHVRIPQTMKDWFMRRESPSSHIRLALLKYIRDFDEK